jgi:hypothetical protein
MHAVLVFLSSVNLSPLLKYVEYSFHGQQEFLPFDNLALIPKLLMRLLKLITDRVQFFLA